MYNDDDLGDTTMETPPFCTKIPPIDAATYDDPDDPSLSNQRQDGFAYNGKEAERSNLRLTNGNNRMEKQVEEKPLTSQPENIGEATIAALEATDAPCGDVQQGSGPQTPATSTESKKRINGGVRDVCAMHKVVMKRDQGMLARTMVRIDIPSWPEVDPNLKTKIWDDIRDTFKVAPESESLILMSAGTKWRQFKSTLTSKYVKPFIGHKMKLRNPPKKYAYVGKDAWIKFVATRSSESWESLSKEQSERVKAGRLEPDEIPDVAIFCKIAHTPPEGTVIDDDLKETFERIDYLIEKKRKGEFIPHGSKDVMSVALNTPKHSGRVRGVGSFVTLTSYFKLPKGKDKRTRITKAEFEKTKNEFEQMKMEFMSQIAELKSELKVVVTASKLQSPISDKASCGVRENEEEPRKCELAVDNIENVVAFGMVFPQDGMSSSVHGVLLQPGYVRVRVDEIIKEDALVPVPIAGEIETICQAVGSLLAWPEDMVIFTPVIGRNLEGSPKQPGGSECGYVVMRYMKDIYEDKEIKFLSKGVKCRKSYTKEQLDEVRFKTLQYIQEFV
ncbi:hypothetical protein AgCh_004264 [Apium graveolens]